MTTEKRSAPRHKVFKGAKIVFHNGSSNISCFVRDISTTGGRLRVETPIGIPDTFTLRMDEDGHEVGCRVVRRAARELGVAFE